MDLAREDKKPKPEGSFSLCKESQGPSKWPLNQGSRTSHIATLGSMMPKWMPKTRHHFISVIVD